MDYNNSLNEYRYLVDLQKEDVDLFLIETMSNIEEARAAITAVKEVDKPVFVALTIKDDLSNKLRSGEDLRLALDVLSNENPISCTCLRSSLNLLKILPEIHPP